MQEQLGEKLAEGRTAEVYAWGEDWVVKLYRQGWERRTAEYEYKQAVASQKTGYRVPQVQQMVEVDGRFGIVYERIEGHTMFDEIKQKPLQFIEYARMMADLHLDMHSRRAEDLDTSQDILASKINRADGLDQPTKDKVLAYLDSLPRGNKLLHGDFHPGNIMMTEKGPIIIDWIDGNIGHPLADVARTTVLGTVGIPPSERFERIFFRVFVFVYLQRYFKKSTYTRREMESWLLPVAAARLGEEIPHEKEALIAWVKRLIRKLT